MLVSLEFFLRAQLNKQVWMRSWSGQFDDAKKEKDAKKRNNTSQSAKTGRSIFLFFCTNLKNTYMKLVLVFGIARIFFVGAYAKSVTKTGAIQAN